MNRVASYRGKKKRKFIDCTCTATHGGLPGLITEGRVKGKRSRRRPRTEYVRQTINGNASNTEESLQTELRIEYESVREKTAITR